jgi:hypothetical protein
MPAPGEPRYDVEVSGGKVGAVGDYATVFQVFMNSPPALTSFLRAPQFRSLVDQRTKGFIGRDFVFDRIDELLGGAEFDSGYVVVRGEPGIGKSAVAATLVARHGYVHHFNIAAENIRSAKQFLENVCAQLIVRFELDHASLPPDASVDSGFLSQLLHEAIDGQSRPLVVVVDALDEVEDSDLPNGANRLFLPRALPSGVFFVLTSREEADYRLDVDHESVIWIREDDPENRADVANYVHAFVDQHSEAMTPRLADWGVQPEEFVEDITRLSEGNFMYLFHVLPEIARGRLVPNTDGGISTLPRGLQSYYQRHWRDMKDADPERFSNVQRPVLCFLAVSREPVSAQQLMDWTHHEPSAVMDVLREWAEFLNQDLDRYRIYHRSFAEFLDKEENLRFYHAQIAQAALAKIPGFLQDDQGEAI